MSNMFAPPTLQDGRSLKNAKIVKGDSVIATFRISGDLSTANVQFAARLKDDIFKTVVISKSNAVDSEVYVEQVTGQLFAECTLHIASGDTAVLDPGTILEYEIQVTDTISYGGSTGGDVSISNAPRTLHQGVFTIIDQVII